MGEAQAGTQRRDWRVRVGLGLFVASISWPLLVPVLPLLGVSVEATATFGGVMLVVAEVMMLAGAAIAGKEGFAYIKGRVFGLLRAYGPPARVGPLRHRIGLVMFVVPLAAGWASPYVGPLVPGLAARGVVIAIVLDLLLLASLFVLGGDFWARLRALFVREPG
jgi:hypothetical protein